MRLGNAADAGGDLGSAVTLYRRAALIQTRDPEPPKRLGMVLIEAGALNEALEAFRAARGSPRTIPRCCAAWATR